MGRKKTPGLYLRDGLWYIDKVYKGRRISGSSGTSNLQEAEAVLRRKIEDIRNASLFGIRPVKTFEEAAAKYLIDNQSNRSIRDDISRLKGLMPFIGHLALDQIHDGTLKPFIAHRRKRVRPKTINNDLEIVGRILNLAARKWRDDDSGKSWLETPPLLTPLRCDDNDRKYPMTMKEQKYLLQELPKHLANAALFKVNVGLREQEVVNLLWDWEYDVPELDASVFIIPAEYVKNGSRRLVVLNKIAQSIVEGQRGQHKTHVFHFRGRPMGNIRNTAWKKARIRAAMRMVRESKDCEVFEDRSSFANRECFVEVYCRRHSRKRGSTTRYTLADYNAERAEKGLTALTPRNKDARLWVYLNGWHRFFREQWAEFDKYARVRVHDLKHTFGSRLAAQDVPLEIRKDLLGHSSGDITTHYSASQIHKLIEAANSVCGIISHETPTLTLLKKKRA